MPFQKVINNTQAPGQAGDFASTNPFASVLAGPGQLVAPAGGLTVGNFFWVGPAGQVSQSFVAGYQIAFLGRNEQALITLFLGEATYVVPQGFMITGFNEGDFWAKFAAGATPGQAVWADPNDGAPISSVSAPALASGTASAGFTGTGSASVAATTTLTIGVATSGIISVGDVISAANIPSGTTIVAQLTVTAGSGAGLLGTYQMSAAATGTLTAGAVTTTSTLLDVTAVAAGAFNFGDVFSGSGVTAGTSIGLQNQSFSGVATITGTTTLTVTAVTPGSGLLYKGDTVLGLGIPASTTISSQTSGTPGGAGVYVLSAASTNAVGISVTNSDTAGGIGTYAISPAQNFAPATITVAGTAQATGFKVRGTYTALANEVAKISTF